MSTPAKPAPRPVSNATKAQTRRAATEHRAAPEPPRIPATAPPATCFSLVGPHVQTPKPAIPIKRAPCCRGTTRPRAPLLGDPRPREPWIVLCTTYHAVFSPPPGSVENQDATFRPSPPDAAGALSVSSVSPLRPGDYVVEPISSNPTAKPPLAAPPGKLLQLRPPSRDPAWLRLVDKALRTLTELVRRPAAQTQTMKRSACSVWSLKNRALEHVAKAPAVEHHRHRSP